MRLPQNAAFRRIAVPLLVAVGLTLTAASPALATPAPPPTYLALGDSVPFGYYENATPAVYANPANFIGYPHYVARATGLSLINASCPGETTDSFMSITATSNGCENRDGVPGGYRSVYPLHANYGMTLVSQLQYAQYVLETTPNVRLVTIMLGADDGFLCAESPLPSYCTGSTDYAGIAQHVRTNMNTILQALRSTGYTGRIIAVTYYSLNYASAQANTGTLLLNGGIDAAAIANHASIASGFLAFLLPSLRAGGDPVKAGLVRPNDVHPTLRGQRLLADAVESVIGF